MIVEATQADKIADALEEMVFVGSFENGQRLDEMSLAEKFGVSRTPVREALQRLVASDLADQLPRRGVFVRQPDAKMVVDMFEAMAEVEGVCGRLAARRISSADLDALKMVNANCAEAASLGNAHGYSQYNEQFHHMLYKFSGNAFLEGEALRIYRKLKPFRRVQFQTIGRMEKSIDEHFALIDALSKAKARRVGKILVDHVGPQGKRFYTRMEQLGRDPSFRIAS